MWRKRLAVGLFALGLLLAGGYFADRELNRRAGVRRLRAVEGELDQTDPGWRLADLLAARPVPPDDRNLTKLCWEAVERLPAGWRERETARGDWLTGDRNRVPAADDVASARRSLADAADAVALVRTARGRTAAGWPLPVPADPLGIRLEHTQRVRTAADLLKLDALLAALDGDGRRAADAVATGLHLARAVGDEPFAVSQLVRMAAAQTACDALERALGWGELPAADLAALAPLLRAEADFPRLLCGERGDRAVAHAVGERVATDRLTLGELAGGREGGLRAGWASWRYAPHLPADRADLLAHYTTVVDTARRPPHERAAVLENLPPFRRDPRRHLLSGLLWPNAVGVARADSRCVARLRCAAAAVGCERFRRANGRWPDALADLGPVPADPFTGGPLAFDRRADGVTVRAAGPAGDAEPAGFRLWDAAARRQAYQPPPNGVWLWPDTADLLRAAVPPPAGGVAAGVLNLADAATTAGP